MSEKISTAKQDEIERQLSILSANAVQIVPENGLRKKLEKAIDDEGNVTAPLKVKFGMDPTAPDIHIGHTVPLFKLRQFQDLGHKIQLLIGDFTASIGDPSGRNKTRPPLSQEQIAENAKTFAEQAFKVLDKDKKLATGEPSLEIVYNTTWCNKLTPSDIIKMLSHVTVGQIMQREEFANRYKNEMPIAMHELLYPIMQGYDSVALESDVEIGGTDQTFNCLMGREMQKTAGLPLQVVLTMPILEGTDGKEKMSKSLGNYIAVRDEPNDMFGKVMSIPDELMLRYYNLLTNIKDCAYKHTLEIEENPMEGKKHLAYITVKNFHSEEAAQAAQEDFETRFSKREIPDELPEFKVAEKEIGLLNLLVEIGFAASTGEARRLVQQGAVKINGEKVDDVKHTAHIPTEGFTLQAGKRRMGKIHAA